MPTLTRDDALRAWVNGESVQVKFAPEGDWRTLKPVSAYYELPTLSKANQYRKGPTEYKVRLALRRHPSGGFDMVYAFPDHEAEPEKADGFIRWLSNWLIVEDAHGIDA